MYNFKKKLVGITSAVSLLAGMCSVPGVGSNVYAGEVETAKKVSGWTYGIYFCPNDIEENDHDTSRDIIEILKADVPEGFSKENNIILETGGTFQWYFEEFYGDYLKEKGLSEKEIKQVIPENIDYSKIQLYKVNYEHEYIDDEGKKQTIPAIELVKNVADYDLSVRDEFYKKKEAEAGAISAQTVGKEYANMGDEKFLQMFVDELDENYPAEHVVLDLYDHGRGIEKGLCFDQYTEDPLTLRELKNVFDNRVKKGRAKYDILGFDACLMSNYDIWLNLAPYAELGIAAIGPELESGWYYTPFLTELGKNYNNPEYTGKELSKDILDAYIEYYKPDGIYTDYYIRQPLKELMGDDFTEEAVQKEVNFKRMYGLVDNVQLCVVDLDEITKTADKFSQLGDCLLDAYRDKEGVNKLFADALANSYNYHGSGFQISGINQFLDSIVNVANERIPVLEESDNAYDAYVVKKYTEASKLAVELKKEIEDSLIYRYDGWEGSYFHDCGGVSLYTPFEYPYKDTDYDMAYFNYNDYREYAVSSSYARLTYLIATSIKKQVEEPEIKEESEIKEEVKEEVKNKEENSDNKKEIEDKKNEKSYVIVKTPKQVKIKSLKKLGKKALSLKWKKIKGVSGYEVKYALNKKFTKGKKVKDIKKASVKLNKLKKKKTYYVSVRAYVLAPDGEKVYGEWSKVKKIKFK